MRRFAPILALLALACGDASDPLPSGPIVLSAEVRHVDPHPYTCEWRLTADADDLSDPAEWMDTDVRYSRANDLTIKGYWLPHRGIEPGEILTGPWHGLGDNAAWSATVVMYYEVAGRTDSASVAFGCG